MRFSFKTEGGIAYFPGLAKPFVFESRDLSKADAKALHALVKAAHFFTLPASINKPAPGAADMQRYTLTIEDDDRTHTVQCIEGTGPDEVQTLFERVQILVTELRANRQD